LPSLGRPSPGNRQTLEQFRKGLREAVRSRIGLRLPQGRSTPACDSRGVVDAQGFTAEKLVLESEPGIRLPALLLTPKQAKAGESVVVHLSDEGKPVSTAQPSLALELVRAGHPVFSLDVRGAGETDPRDRAKLKPLTGYEPQQFQFDSSAVCAAQLGTTLLAMQTLDVIRGLDWLAARDALAGRPVVLVGEGLGGVWALAGAAFDRRPVGVACVRTIPSYRLIVDSPYYASRDYFWVPRALATFDLPDLAALVAPRRVAWIDPVDAMLAPLPQDRCLALYDWPRGVYLRLGAPQALEVAATAGGTPADAAGQVLKFLAPDASPQ